MTRWMHALRYASRRVALTAVALGSASAVAQDAELQRGLALYEQGAFEEALQAFAAAGEPDDPRILPELLHNRAATQFQLGELDAARELWVRAAGLRDAAFEARARYNIGNCHYQAALRAAGATPPDATAAVDALSKAIEQYRDALRLDRSLSSARANLELAAQLKQFIEQNSASQPSSKPDANPDETGEKQPQSQPRDKQDQQESSEQDNSEQGSDSEGEPNESERQNPQTQPAENQEGAGSPDEPEPQSQPASQPRPQPQPSGEADQTQENEMRPRPQIQMTPEEAARLLQKIRDLERARRAQLQARQSNPRPVEKDW